jgi:hypothetical protein
MVNGIMLLSLILSKSRSRNGTFINYRTLSAKKPPWTILLSWWRCKFTIIRCALGILHDPKTGYRDDATTAQDAGSGLNCSQIADADPLLGQQSDRNKATVARLACRARQRCTPRALQGAGGSGTRRTMLTLHT